MPLRVRFILCLPVIVSVLTFTAYGRSTNSAVIQSSFTLSTSQSQVAPGGQLTVNWTAPSGRPTNDWIALYKVGDANTTYGSWQYTQSATSGNFTVTAPSQTGRYEFRYLLQGGYTDVVRSNVVPITVAPSTSITSPSNNTTFNAPVNITINATASDADGISKVEFFQGSTKLGESVTSPYSFAWNSAPAGSFALTAKATDLLGAVTTSNAINITVNPAPGAISGKVTKLDGTTAIAGATVKVFQGAVVLGNATSNSTGDYTVSGLANASYSVVVSAPGYETNSQTGVSVANGGTTTLNVSLAIPISYLYDQLGRLVGVIDKDGNAATYAYDAVGNLLSISRQSPSQVSILQFTPSNGLAGASVSIYGTGFSATASQNTVTFNGTAATVVSASTTLIVTNVPSGATTGPIAVTSPIGSATSATSFNVSAGATGAPTITAFTPTIGAAGTSVTITGNNFDTTVANDRASFNVMRSLVSSATATSIATTVPSGATSGHISVATPSGKATSTGDFFAPPAPYTASDVVLTSRMSIGTNSTITIGTANKVGLMLFEGTLGQRVSINIVPATISGSLAIYRPDGTSLLPSTSVSSGKFFDPMTLPADGTYTILVSAQTTGSMTIALYNVIDLSGSITPGGASVPLLFAVPGQNGSLTFNGTQNQRVSLLVTSVTTTGSGQHTIKLYKPDGSVLATLSDIANNSFLDTQTLPVPGTYTLVADPSGAAMGNWTLTLYDVPQDASGTITPGGAAVTVTTSTSGQNGALTFTGTANQRISLYLTNVTSGPYISIRKPDGTNLVSPVGVSSGSFIDTKTLPVVGTYTIFIDPPGKNTGNITLTLYDVPADITGSISPGGSSVAVTTTVSGQNALLTFSGTSGQRVSLNMTSVTITGTNVTIYKPDGSVLAGYANVTPPGAFLDAVTLPVSGTYSIGVDPLDIRTGNMTLTLYDATDFSGSTTVGGSSVAITISSPGQNGQVTFSGTSGQQVTVHVTSNTVAGVTVKLLKPDGSQLTSSFSSSSSFNLTQQTLPTTGTYTIVIDPSGTNIGSLNVSVTSP
ncbi:MAG TPA: Ig-like domain-containing protein [Blastocatellia bacterium]|nr:Ig-like domain-containing protein [Blastocatellia bacterium]